jgi:hypothetical protein
MPWIEFFKTAGGDSRVTTGAELFLPVLVMPSVSEAGFALLSNTSPTKNFAESFLENNPS